MAEIEIALKLYMADSDTATAGAWIRAKKGVASTSCIIFAPGETKLSSSGSRSQKKRIKEMEILSSVHRVSAYKGSQLRAVVLVQDQKGRERTVEEVLTVP